MDGWIVGWDEWSDEWLLNRGLRVVLCYARLASSLLADARNPFLHLIVPNRRLVPSQAKFQPDAASVHWD